MGICAAGMVSACSMDGEYLMDADGSYMKDGGYMAAEGGFFDGGSGEGEEGQQAGEAGVITAAEWNDNRYWPFFTNLVSSGRIRFPSFGIDPRQRIPVQLTDADGSPLANERVQLLDGEDTVLWTARSDKDGNAYLHSSGSRPGI